MGLKHSLNQREHVRGHIVSIIVSIILSVVIAAGATPDSPASRKLARPSWKDCTPTLTIGHVPGTMTPLWVLE